MRLTKRLKRPSRVDVEISELAFEPLVSVLFARADSVYKMLPGVDVWDAERDARKWPGGNPVVAHPPCRAWGRLRHMARPRPGEKDLALFAVEQVRRWGGVLEHPAGSTLFASARMPRPGAQDAWGFSFGCDQRWWGHRANKDTWLYICGTRDIPPFPIDLSDGTHAIAIDRRPGVQSRNAGKARLPTAEREHTPPEFARWLVALARRCSLDANDNAIARARDEVTE